MSGALKCRGWATGVAFLAACVVARIALGAGVISVNLPWARPAALHATTEVYMEIASSESAAITAARSPDAERVSIRTSSRVGPSNEIALPAQTTVLLEPRKQRLVLSGLKRALRVGDHVSVTITLKHPTGASQDIDIQAEVRTGSARDQEGREHSH